MLSTVTIGYLKTRENEGSVSVRQDIHDLLYDTEPKADSETFDVTILVDAKTKMCGATHLGLGVEWYQCWRRSS